MTADSPIFVVWIGVGVNGVHSKDTRAMESRTASQQQHAHEQENEQPPSPTHTLDTRDADVMAQFLARFDPLAILEAEYAAVLAQSSASSPSSSKAAATTTKRDGLSASTSGRSDNNQRRHSDSDGDSSDNSNEEDDDNDDVTRDDSYAQLPMSPTGNGEYYQPLGDDSDADDDQDSDHDDNEADTTAPARRDSTQAAAMQTPQLDAATRRTVMQSMQRLTLAPPAWAKDARLSDDDLVALVQRHLQQE